MKKHLENKIQVLFQLYSRNSELNIKFLIIVMNGFLYNNKHTVAWCLQKKGRCAMLIHNKEFGRIEIRDIPLSRETIPLLDDMKDISGTYTSSGRVLVSGLISGEEGEQDRYQVLTIRDDGTDMHKVFEGVIPRRKGANGIRWMCFADNKRILLGDYILECQPDVDRCERARLLRVYYPEDLDDGENIFFRWSEIVIAPDNIHMCWTMLTYTGSVNYLGRLKREEDCYRLEDVYAISHEEAYEPDPEHEGYVLPVPARGGELKQVIRGGKALSMAGGGDSVSESMILPLDSHELIQLTDTPGYEETTILSPDERLGVVMSPRFSQKTNCGVFGLVPQPHAFAVSGKLINCLYMYCVSGVRQFRKGNIGPVLIDIDRSLKEGRACKGADLSDPEGKWVYYSPISWHPDSTRAMWIEGTRPAEGEKRMRLRMCHLLDREASHPVPAGKTPDGWEVPYAVPAKAPSKRPEGAFSVRIKGKHSGFVVNECEPGNPPLYRTVYHQFSDDGKTFYSGSMRVKASANIFAPGETVFEADAAVTGAHVGAMKLRAVFRRDRSDAPAMLSFAPGEDGLPESHGWSAYDGQTLYVEDMEP